MPFTICADVTFESMLDYLVYRLGPGETATSRGVLDQSEVIVVEPRDT